MKTPCVYILCNRPFATLYVGVTSNLSQRMSQHVQGVYDGFTKRHGICRLVYYEMHQTMFKAINREKQLKRWHRIWKYRLIATMNPSGRTCSIPKPVPFYSARLMWSGTRNHNAVCLAPLHPTMRVNLRHPSAVSEALYTPGSPNESHWISAS